MEVAFELLRPTSTAFGVLIYEAFVGHGPYVGAASANEVLQRRRRSEADACLSCAALESDRDYANVAKACVRFDPDQRPTASELARLLEALLPGRAREATAPAPHVDGGYVLEPGEYVEPGRVADNVVRQRAVSSAVQTATDALSGHLWFVTEGALNERGRAHSGKWLASSSVATALRSFETVRADALFGGFADTFVRIVFAGHAIDARDGAFDRELRQYAVRAKFVGDDARSRSVTRHVHCVRAVELAFFKHCHSRYVLCRDEPGQSDNVVERRTPAEFLALLENGEQRQKMCGSVGQAGTREVPAARPRVCAVRAERRPGDALVSTSATRCASPSSNGAASCSTRSSRLWRASATTRRGARTAGA
jgi:hypothetical protein